MGIIDIILIGIALAMDAFALTIANCTAYEKNLNRKKEWSMPVAFAVFQFGMPLLGFILGGLISDFIQSFAKFLTAGIFFILSAKIVFDILDERVKNRNEKNAKPTAKTQNFTLGILVIQAIATSIDAFAVGITFAATSLPFNVFIATGIIGFITFGIVTVALFIGKSLGKLLGEYAVWCGTVILFALAIKNLIEGII